MLRIRKDFNKHNSDYEDTTAQESHSDRSYKKRTPEFFSEMIYNDQSGS